MKSKVVLFVLIVIALISGACSSGQPAEPNGSQTEAPVTEAVSTNAPVTETPAQPSVFDEPANPINVSVEVDYAQTVSELIPASGGSLALTDSKGNTFTLEIPPGALDTDMVIQMTPINAIGNLPLSGGFAGAVQLEPSGLQLNELATLTIQLASEIPVADQILFGFEKNGEDLHHALIDPKSEEIKILLQGFSGAGVGQGTDEDRAAMLVKQADNEAVRLRNQMGALFAAQRRAILVEGADDPGDEFYDQVEKNAKEYYEKVVKPKIEAAKLDCKQAKEAVKELIAYERAVQLLGAESVPTFHDDVEALLKIAEQCERQSYTVSGDIGVPVSGVICDTKQPFTLTDPLRTWSFTPADEKSGHFTYTGNIESANLYGGGGYTISADKNGGTLELGSGTGCASEPQLGTTCSNGNTATLTLTPLGEGQECP